MNDVERVQRLDRLWLAWQAERFAVRLSPDDPVAQRREQFCQSRYFAALRDVA